MSSMEPGLDLHEWQTRLEQLQPALHETPDAALPELADLVGEIMEARGYQLGERTTEAGEERELVASYDAARDTADRAEAGEADPGDVADAVNQLRAIYDTLTVERATP